MLETSSIAHARNFVTQIAALHTRSQGGAGARKVKSRIHPLMLEIDRQRREKAARLCWPDRLREL